MSGDGYRLTEMTFSLFCSFSLFCVQQKREKRIFPALIRAAPRRGKAEPYFLILSVRELTIFVSFASSLVAIPSHSLAVSVRRLTASRSRL